MASGSATILRLWICGLASEWTRNGRSFNGLRCTPKAGNMVYPHSAVGCTASFFLLMVRKLGQEFNPWSKRHHGLGRLDEWNCKGSAISQSVYRHFQTVLPRASPTSRRKYRNPTTLALLIIPAQPEKASHDATPPTFTFLPLHNTSIGAWTAFPRN